MSDYLDDFNGTASAPLNGHDGGAGAWSADIGVLDGAGNVRFPMDSSGTATLGVADSVTEVTITGSDTSGTFVFGTSDSTFEAGAANTGAQCFYSASVNQAWLQSALNSSDNATLPGSPPWQLRLEAAVGDTTIKLFCNDALLISYAGEWLGAGVAAFDRTTFYCFGDGASGDDLLIGALKGGGGLTPSGPTHFWTSFVATHEKSSTPDTSPDIPPDPGSAGSSKDNAFPVTAPYETTVTEAMDGTPIWWKVTVPSSGMWRFTTRNSPDGGAYDTWLGLYNSAGAVLSANDDIDTSGSDYRSLIEISLTAADYYLVLSSYPASAAAGFVVTPGNTAVPAGTVLTIETF